jgi:hypothetical protein
MQMARSSLYCDYGTTVDDRSGPPWRRGFRPRWKRCSGTGRNSRRWIASKIDLITDLQAAGYFVLLVLAGLPNAEASILRVMTRVQQGGHGIQEATLRRWFPKTQKAIATAPRVADASLLVDNSRSTADAFAVCRVQAGAMPRFDVRRGDGRPPEAILAWLDVVPPE